MSRERIVNLILMFLSVCSVLIFLEISLRMYSLYTGRDQFLKFEEHLQNQMKYFPDHNVSFAQLIQKNDDPKIIYDFIPSSSAIVEWRRVVINRDGYRGKMIQKKKPEGTLRIIGIGDSVMFGWGVEESECFLEKLQGLLARHYGQYNWEILNTAVPGYNAVMEVNALARKGLEYEPDVVIYNFIGNDIDLPNFIRGRYQARNTAKSFLVEFIRKRFRPSDNPFQWSGELVNAPFNSQTARFENQPESVPEIYRDLVGMESFKRAMQEFKQLSLKEHFIPLIITYGKPVNAEELKALWEEVGIRYCVITFEEFRKDFGVQGFLPPLGLSPVDPHPSKYGHEVIARELFETVIREMNAATAEKGYEISLQAMQEWAAGKEKIAVEQLELKEMTDWKASYYSEISSIKCRPGELISIPCTVRNTGSEIWHYEITRGNDSFFMVMSYRISDCKGALIEHPVLDSILTARVRSGETVKVKLAVIAPDIKGEYLISASLVQKGVAWFDERGVVPLKINLTVL